MIAIESNKVIIDRLINQCIHERRDLLRALFLAEIQRVLKYTLPAYKDSYLYCKMITVLETNIILYQKPMPLIQDEEFKSVIIVPF